MPTLPYAIGTKLQNAATATGNGATLDVSEHPAILVEVAGITSATIDWEGAGTSGLVRATSVIETATHVPAVSATRDGLYVVSCAGLDTLRARIASYASGTITVTVRESLSYPEANLIALSTIQSTVVTTLSPRRLQYVDFSGTVTLGGTAQIALPANLARNAYWIRNSKYLLDNTTPQTEDLWICVTATASPSGVASIPLRPGDMWIETAESVTTQAVSIYAMTTGHVYKCQEAS